MHSSFVRKMKGCFIDSDLLYRGTLFDYLEHAGDKNSHYRHFQCHYIYSRIFFKKRKAENSHMVYICLYHACRHRR